MARFTSVCFYLAFLASVGFVGCGEEEGGGGLQCPDLCEIGESRCEGDGVSVACVEDASGCGVPEVELCGAGEVCDEGECVDRVCDEGSCEIGASSCQDEGTQQVCVAGPDGCGVEVSVACGSGAVCVDGACSGACVDGDADGFGQGCEAGLDCNDGDGGVHPGVEELCDGVDNNCDGQIDEGFEGLGEGCAAGVGACEVEGKVVCGLDGRSTACDGVPGVPQGGELCDNEVDDDCDGEVDEGFERLGEACLVGIGVCQVEGAFVCGEAGQEVCEGQPGEPEEAESCNGQDDDCDGEVDEDFETLGQECQVGQGVCQGAGVIVCGDAGDAVCDGVEGEPSGPELCGNGQDDDCDGEVDEGFDQLGSLCEAGRGSCRAVGVFVCGPGGRGTACSARVGEPGAAELCGNGIDDDCDGRVDEGFEAIGTACEVGEGACGTQGAQVCDLFRLSLVCGAQQGEPADGERCDGLDNDCNGQIDEDFVDLRAACTEGVGICARQGVRVCAIDGSRTACNATPGAPLEAELCGNGVDDDCDGEVDEGFEALGQACTSGQGVCARNGAQVCSGDRLALVCGAQPGERGQEICDGLDNDCDGVADDDGVCGGCVNDGFEPNNADESAASIEVGDRLAGTICFFDRDVYSVGVLPAGGVLVINALFSHADGDIDVGVFRDGQFVPEATGGSSVTDNEQVVVPLLQAGEYTIHLLVIGGTGAVDYDLSVFVTQEQCQDDIFEHDDGPEQAHALPVDQPREMVACSEDAPQGGDWFDLGEMEANTLVGLTARFLHGLGDIDLFLLDALGEIVDSGVSVTDDELIEVLIVEPGQYFARAEAFGQGVSNPYTLTFSREDDVCVDDAFEDIDNNGVQDGDTPETALLVPEGAVATAVRACRGDDDWFVLNREYLPGEVVQFNAVFDRSEGNLDVEMFINGTETLVAVGNSDGSNEVVRHRVTTQGRYIVRVFAVEGQPSYKLSHLPRRLDGCVPDAFESDNALNAAIQGVPGRSLGLVSCPTIQGGGTEFDIVSLGTLPAGVRLSALATFTHDRGDVDMFLFLDGSFVAQAVSSDDDEVINFNVPLAGDYFLVTILSSDPQSDGNAYRLRYTLQQ